MTREEDYLAAASSTSATESTKQASSSSSSGGSAEGASAESQPTAVASIERVAESVLQEIEAMDQQINIGGASGGSANQQNNPHDGLSGAGGHSSQGSISLGLESTTNNQEMPNSKVPNLPPGDQWDALANPGTSHSRRSNSTGRRSKASRSSSKKKKHRIKPPAVIETSSVPSAQASKASKGILKNSNHGTDSKSVDLSSEEGDQIGELPTILGREQSMGSVSFLTNNKSAGSSNFSSGNLSSTGLSDTSSSSVINEALDPTPMRHNENAAYPNPLAFEKAKAGKYNLNDNRDGAINFLLDDPQEMTRSRRMALGWVHNKFYNPIAGKKVRRNNTSVFDSVSSADMISSQKVLPSLEKAWAYFEHVTLTRYIIHERNQNPAEMTYWQRYKYAYTHSDELFERAQPGEKRLPTRLYDWISTPHIQVCIMHSFDPFRTLFGRLFHGWTHWMFSICYSAAR